LAAGAEQHSTFECFNFQSDARPYASSLSA